MTKLSRVTLTVCLLVVSFGSLIAQDSLKIKTDKIFEDYIQENGPGFAVILMEDQAVKMQKYYGYAELTSLKPITSETKINLGTLSKQFTAMGIMILKEEGKLDYGDKITKYIGNIPEYASHITIEHLLEETSGLPAISLRGQKDGAQTPEQVLSFLNEKDELVFESGKRAASNPVNFALLTLIIEKVADTDYRSFVHNRIFKPLNMENSEVYKGGWFYKVKNKAEGYQNIGTPDSVVFEMVPEEVSKEYMRGVTGIYVSPEDMVKWMKAWNSEELVGKKTISQAQRLNFIRGAKEFYGFGWRKAFNKGKKYLYQGGIGYGHTHVTLLFPREKITVIILSNQRAVYGMRKRAFELVNLVSEEKYEVR